MVRIAMNNTQQTRRPQRRRFQRGSLQKRKFRGGWHWIAFWWEDHRRRSQILGPCSGLNRPEALAAMAKRLAPVNAQAGQPVKRIWTVGDWIRDAFLPLSRRKWKLSTASTTSDRIRKHVVTDLGALEMSSLTRDRLQQYLDDKAEQGCSFSVVDHLRWDLRAIFRLAAQDGVLASNPAELLYTPRTPCSPSRRVLSAEQVHQILDALDIREQLIVRLALFSGMRPGEILALQWKHVREDHLDVVHRLYRGRLDRPKSERSKRMVALPASTQQLMKAWRLSPGSGTTRGVGLPIRDANHAAGPGQCLEMVDCRETENDWTGVGHVSDHAADACDVVAASEYRSQARRRSTRSWFRCESRCVYGCGTRQAPRSRRGSGSLAGEYLM
jgi:hypothetical protein